MSSLKEISIGKRKIGPAHPPFLIAELSGNHKGSLETAFSVIDAAKAAGVDALKLQTYTPDTITLDVKDKEFLVLDTSSLWKGRALYDLYQEAHTPWEWHEALFNRCRQQGLIAFSTPFDETAVDFLEKLEVPCYKVASPEIVDIPLIRKIAATRKPMIISTGGATLEEIGEAVEAARSSGCKELVLLKCTMSYPAKSKDMNLMTLPHLSATFDTLVGLSDHTLGIGAALASIPLGASVIEKHMTLSRKEGGVDSAFSMEPQEFAQLAKESKSAWEALGKIHYGCLPSEKQSFAHRPSLYFVEDLSAGTTIQPHHIRSVRPNNGLPPKEIDNVIGLTLKHSVVNGTPVSWNHFHQQRKKEA